MHRKYKIIGAASGWGAQVRTCEDGPTFLKEHGCLKFLREHGIALQDWETLFPKTLFKEKNIPLSEAFPLIVDFNHMLEKHVAETMEADCFPVIIGGDHTNAVGTWKGVAKSLKGKPFGLIWIDAHMDAHTPETTPSGAWHGMPLACLLGYGPKGLVSAPPVLKPQHLCLIGTRSFEEGEAALLQRLGVQIYFMDEVKRRGLKEVLQEAIAYVNQGTCGFGVSLDIDSVDPIEAPGAGSPEPNGIHAKELLASLPLIGRDPRLKAFELVEFNPHRDKNGMTAELCKQILLFTMSQEGA